ncbi:tetratricopeptide repeat protein [Bacteroides sp. OttesenSCG-928-N06]|nr:tetratricopeptide repeat protein [Bacteroides sp. OttesenSCG-928-N06]
MPQIMIAICCKSQTRFAANVNSTLRQDAEMLRIIVLVNVDNYFVILEKSYIFAFMIAKNPLITCMPFLLFIFSCYSCTSGKVTDPVLLRADSLMECCADSALALLEDMEYPQEMKRNERAFYGLLLTKARDKCLVEHTSDSIMKLVVAYYQQHGSTYQKMESLYYLASVYRDLGDAPRALDYFGRAADASKDQTEYRLLGLIYSQMGTLFFYQNLHEEGVAAYRQSYRYDLLAEDSLISPYSFMKMARIQTFLGNVDSTLYYYKEAVSLAQKVEKYELAKDIQIELADIYLQQGEYKEARKYLNIRSAADYLNWGDYYFNTNLFDSASFYYQNALEKSNIYIRQRAYFQLYKIEKLRGDDNKSLRYFEQSSLYKDSITQITNTEGVKRVESLYNYQHIQKHNSQLLQERQQNKMISIISVFVVILLGLIISILFAHFRRKKQEWKGQTRRTQYFQLQEIEQKDEKIEDLKKQIVLLQHKKEQEKVDIFLQSTICQLIVDNASDPDFKMNKERWAELQNQIDETYNQFTERLRIHYCRISEKEIQVCLLLKTGIQNKSISRLVHMAHNSVSSLRARLYEKVCGKSGSAKEWDEFIRNF